MIKSNFEWWVICLDFRTEKTNSSFKEISFHLIPPEEFVEGKITFELCIGQVIYPLNIPVNCFLIKINFNNFK